MGLAFTGLVVGSSVVFVVHRIGRRWFHKVFPSSDPLLCLLDANDGCDVDIGYDGDDVSHLSHNILPLSPLLHGCMLPMELRNWWVSSVPTPQRIGTEAKTMNLSTGVAVAATDSNVGIIRFGWAPFVLAPLGSLAFFAWMVLSVDYDPEEPNRDKQPPEEP